MAGVTKYGSSVRKYSIGDTGPAGGVIFITPDTAGNTTGQYFEAAPLNWHGNGQTEYLNSATYGYATVYWADPALSSSYLTTSISGATGTAIGTGQSNTTAIVTAIGNVGYYAAKICDDLTFGGYSDWFLPSREELKQLIKNRSYANLQAEYNGPYYVTSSQSAADKWFQIAGNEQNLIEGSWLNNPTFGEIYNYSTLKQFSGIMRPVRAFYADNVVKKQRLGNDAIYGMGTDGDVTISANTTLTSDKYYNNLTVNAGVVLNTGGFKVFVKNTLTLNGYIGIGTVTAGVVGEPSSIATGTLYGHSSSTAITYSIGGTGGGPTASTATQISSTVLQSVEETLFGVVRVADSTFVPIAGGAAGTTGNTTPPLTNNDNWTGKAGSPGQAGSPNQNVVGAAGGTGNPGTATGATSGAGGAGGKGGPIVMVIAKSITGSGTIFSLGISGAIGSTGTGGANGNAAPHLAALNATCNAHATNCHGNHSCFGNHNASTCNAHAVVCNAAHHVCNGHAYNHSNCSDTCHVANFDCVSASENCHGNHNASTCNAHGCNAHATNCTGNHNASHGAYNGGAGGAGAPPVVGGRGGAGGGGGIIVVTDSTPSGISYNMSGGLVVGSGSNNATSGYNYVILNT